MNRNTYTNTVRGAVLAFVMMIVPSMIHVPSLAQPDMVDDNQLGEAPVEYGLAPRETSTLASPAREQARKNVIHSNAFQWHSGQMDEQGLEGEQVDTSGVNNASEGGCGCAVGQE